MVDVSIWTFQKLDKYIHIIESDMDTAREKLLHIDPDWFNYRICNWYPITDKYLG